MANFIKNNQVRYACNAEDSEALARLIPELDENELKNIGKDSKVVYFKKYSKEKFITKLLEALTKSI